MSSVLVPRSLFRCGPLADSETEYLLQLASQVPIQVIRRAQLDNGSIHWTLATDDADVVMYQGNDATNMANTWCTITEVQATLEEAAALFAGDTPVEYERNHKALASDVLDCYKLYTLNPDVGVYWSVLQSPAPALANPRDFCFLQSQGEFEHAGHRGFVVAKMSVTVSGCPDLQDSHGYVRGLLYPSGFVFTELGSRRPGYVQVTHVVQVDPLGKTKLPPWIYKRGMATRVKGLRQVGHQLRLNRLSQAAFRTPDQLVPKDTRTKCFLCQCAFRRVFVKKCRCRLCGEVMCHTCCKHWPLVVAGIPTTVRICSSCALKPNLQEYKARGNVMELLPLMQSSLSISASRSTEGGSSARPPSTSTSSASSTTNPRHLDKPRVVVVGTSTSSSSSSSSGSSSRDRAKTTPGSSSDDAHPLMEEGDEYYYHHRRHHRSLDEIGTIVGPIVLEASEFGDEDDGNSSGP
ncbi:hypothetical protein H257_14748 [Aphanomyces astaci]|uniref:FYVE-type domain-containing protein n=1 Tax=Aphanomyces astaci TaxID=112090 RepID=W4FS21_APHAT|nr:hypothetical protein H257_14748 [Aphanomyces astaci]ETV69609.1 hypothetical protein H257_14748 [Aphanomyces astaci]|eukprot:XP_009840936.1 hypothetical protein H257_14748 [Aphanomyces astaci]